MRVFWTCVCVYIIYTLKRNNSLSRNHRNWMRKEQKWKKKWADISLTETLNSLTIWQDDFFFLCTFTALSFTETARNLGRWWIHVETIASQLPMSNNTFSTDSEENGLRRAFHCVSCIRFVFCVCGDSRWMCFCHFDSTFSFAPNILLEVVIVKMWKYCFGPRTMDDDVVGKKGSKSFISLR